MTDNENAADLYTAMRKAADAAAATYVGLTIEAAREKAGAAGTRLRVSSQDGEPYMLTADHIPGRVTVSVDNGVVTTSRVEI